MEPFDSHVLCEDSGFSVAVDTFQVEVLRNRRRFELERGLEDIVARPGLFPRLVSRIDDESFGLLWAYLKNELLQEPDSDFRESIPLKMVTGLRAYFEELSIPVVDVDVQARKTTKYLSQLLKSAEDFGGLAPTSAGKSTPREEKARRGFVRTVRDLAYPLKTYLDIIRDERMADTITRYHIGQLEAEGVRPAGQREAVVGTTSPTSTILSRKRAAVTLDLLDGHGPWKITVSTRMIENLRASKGSPRLFAKIGSTLQ
ncbi:hypothetical protein PsYK624_104360 [Phanerochaete sordida]|uniref:Uncharacterized protein n=1 Tax=Phanerochaete sordida TaxID=48140 RepID=A0A9P3GEL6_9APHY|nr:hypothetical protein PsYK624_104360 [Phanerochaete sordida]